VARWSREWTQWRTRPEATDALARWGQRHPCLAGLTSMAEAVAACGLDRSIPQEIADERLAAVVAEARNGDHDAARLVLQRVLPPLVHRASLRTRRDGASFAAVLDDLMASAWLVITEYPLRARPTKIAVNVIKDAEYRLYGYVPIMVRKTVLMAPENLPHWPLREGTGETRGDDPQPVLGRLPRMLLDEVAAGYPLEDARLLIQLFVFGLSVNEIAAGQQVSPRWIRYRRQQALTRLATQLGHRPSPTASDQVSPAGQRGRTRPAHRAEITQTAPGARHRSPTTPSVGTGRPGEAGE